MQPSTPSLEPTLKRSASEAGLPHEDQIDGSKRQREPSSVEASLSIQRCTNTFIELPVHHESDYHIQTQSLIQYEPSSAALDEARTKFDQILRNMQITGRVMAKGPVEHPPIEDALCISANFLQEELLPLYSADQVHDWEQWQNRMTEVLQKRDSMYNRFNKAHPQLMKRFINSVTDLITFIEWFSKLCKWQPTRLDTYLRLEEAAGNKELTIKRQSEAYEARYLGDSAKNFIAYVRTLSAGSLYSPCISIIQSSGTGKSRMLTEAGKEVFTIPICIRKPESGWPPADDEVHTFLTTSIDSPTARNTHERFVAFLSALFGKVHEELNSHSFQSQRELLDWWHPRMEGSDQKDRTDFYSRVVKEAKEIELTFSLRSDRPSIIPNAPATDERGRPCFDCDAQQFEKYLGILASAYVDNLTNLIGVVRNTPSDKTDTRLPMIVVFDEASTLDSRFWALQRVLRAFRIAVEQSSAKFSDVPIWTVFMATNGSVGRFTPAAGDASSNRVLERTLKILPPYCDLDFDHGMEDYCKSHMLQGTNLGEMEQLQWLRMYGRPMWYTLQDPDPVTFALSKLLNGNLENPDEGSSLAIWSQRIYLDTVTNTTGAVLANDTVAHNMRILSGVSDDFSYRFTTTGSEPILALGAAHGLYNFQHFEASLKHVTHSLITGKIEKGRFGEMGARFVTTVARDLASVSDMYPNLQKPVTVHTFFQSLLGNEYGGASIPADMRETFKRSYINFTHWVTTDSEITRDTPMIILSNLWSRHLALQCRHCQCAIDAIWPVYMDWDKAKPFDANKLSYLVIQYKCKEAGSTDAQLDTFRPFEHSIKEASSILLFFDFGTESAFDRRNGPRVKLFSPATMREELARLPPGERYTVHVRGGIHQFCLTKIPGVGNAVEGFLTALKPDRCHDLGQPMHAFKDFTQTKGFFRG